MATHLIVELISDPINTVNNFKWENDVTPFSTVWAPLFASIAYLVVIFGLQEFMKNRKEIKLHGICVVHNLFLSGLSLVMLLGMMIPLLTNEATQGLEHLVCKPTTAGRTEFWYYIFYLSKVYEFLDTVFLVLRKKKLIFLHVYHHFITYWLCWANLRENTSVQWADISINCFVHIVMYYYYYKTEMGQSPWWKKYITRIQIVQFVYDLTFHSLWRYYHAQSNGGCNGSLRGTAFSDFVILSFLGLFLQFYFKSYSAKKDKTTNNIKKD
ncbi:long chain fatty acid elongase [Cavenderia fasciculata]|uniref:Elongation of fatty acids protein n=1 Tax=Cavenderia fasciculata TaxID=261658 RepID=F4PGG5_CACFS|nr:long chain fatty acid elongase [Cavenderia fasciculata]EGG24799.1 long chain fatty acid elongase [Cavenderia fasciculata]|eukprot:XP_004362650.1 long chain fatty acid elongase [Cavenderia fasciculata]